MRHAQRTLSRRHFLGVSAATGATFLLAACGDDDEDTPATAPAAQAATEPTNTPQPAEPTEVADEATEEPDATATVAEPDPTPTEPVADATPSAAAEDATATPGEGTSDDEVQVLVADVLDYELDANGRWDGPFGSVTLQMHSGHVDDLDVMFIRTDASDREFAEQEGLVWVPLMAGALQAEGSYAHIYLFERGTEGQGAVLTTTPGQDDYTPAFRVHHVRFSGDPELLTSEAAILEASGNGDVDIEETDIIVNYPFIRWGDDGLPVDPDLMEPLGPGPLVEEPDMEAMTCTFKLHECFPGSRYIVTDTSAVPMAPMMGVVGSGATEALRDVRAVAPITIFVNGLAGPGVMGFQPAVFNESAGHPAWSPFWDHFAAEWADPDAAVVVRSQRELDDLVASGDLILYNGLPDTHPMGFIVNCPAPILAPNEYEP